MLRGFGETSAPTLVVMDADLSHPPERIPDLLAPLDDGAGMVFGSRRVRGATTDEGWGVRRWAASRLASVLLAPLTSLRDPTSGFFAVRRTLLDRSGPMRPVGYKIGLEILVRARCDDVREVPIHFAERTSGSSKLDARQALRFLEHVRRLYAAALRRALLYPRAPGAGGLVDGAGRPARRGAWLVASLAIIALTVGVYAPALSFEFLGYDDRFHVHENRSVLEPGAERFAAFWAAPYGNLYVPLAYNLFALQAIAADRGPDGPPNDSTRVPSTRRASRSTPSPPCSCCSCSGRSGRHRRPRAWARRSSRCTRCRRRRSPGSRSSAACSRTCSRSAHRSPTCGRRDPRGSGPPERCASGGSRCS